mmetsp:Transcript_5196/g.13203  ORF Transcript_5196/g.13203 Transcript_5196/m.13203 type:complete len:165 (-) Transcript_5196:261-755(-)
MSMSIVPESAMMATTATSTGHHENESVSNERCLQATQTARRPTPLCEHSRITTEEEEEEEESPRPPLTPAERPLLPAETTQVPAHFQESSEDKAELLRVRKRKMEQERRTVKRTAANLAKQLAAEAAAQGVLEVERKAPAKQYFGCLCDVRCATVCSKWDSTSS